MSHLTLALQDGNTGRFLEAAIPACERAETGKKPVWSRRRVKGKALTAQRPPGSRICPGGFLEAAIPACERAETGKKPVWRAARRRRRVKGKALTAQRPPGSRLRPGRFLEERRPGFEKCSDLPSAVPSGGNRIQKYRLGEGMNTESKLLSIFLCGDVMVGRGIDQILPFAGAPKLYESYVRDARDYVRLAEKANGPIKKPVSFKYIWGDALAELERFGSDLRVINLETSITCDGKPWPGKGIHYRMNPDNTGCLTAARISGCSLANNHVLDWGYSGLLETLESLDRAGVAHAGAGRDAGEAGAPAIFDMPGKPRVLFFSFGSVSSGIPSEWRATAHQPGVNLLDEISEASASRAAGEMRRFQKPGDVVIASIHWGGNWGYEVPEEQIAFAHRLIDEGAALVHGHSSHHVKAVEVYKDHPILYGAGDFLSDYEGIAGYEMFRGDLTLMYLTRLDPQSGRLVSARLVPMQMRRFSLNRASSEDARWLCDLLNQLGARFGTRVEMAADNSMRLVWQGS